MYTHGRFSLSRIKQLIRTHSITEAKNFKCYRRLINKQLLSGLCRTLLLSYLPKRSTQIYRAQYGNAILVSFRGTPTWRSEINENIWNSFLLWERLVFPREVVYIHIYTSSNTWTVQTAKILKKRLCFERDSLVTAPSWCYVLGGNFEFKML